MIYNKLDVDVTNQNIDIYIRYGKASGAHKPVPAANDIVYPLTHLDIWLYDNLHRLLWPQLFVDGIGKPFQFISVSNLNLSLISMFLLGCVAKPVHSKSLEKYEVDMQ